MADQDGNVYAPPQARVADVQTAGEFELAGRGTRLVAVLVDGLTFALTGIVAAIVIPAVAKSPNGATIAVTVLGAVMLALLVVNIVLLHRNGQTIGKRTMGIKVVMSNGNRIGVLRIFFLRFLPVAILGAIPLAGFVIGLLDPLLIFRESRQCLHDSIADTIVIKA
jgi:uncharacterized RDD family membrane protein YckC